MARMQALYLWTRPFSFGVKDSSSMSLSGFCVFYMYLAPDTCAVKKILNLCSPNEDFGRLNRPFRILFLRTFMLPNDDFERSNKRRNADFEGSTFQGREYSILATNHCKVNRKSGYHLLYILPKSSFGDHAIAQFLVGTRLGSIKFRKNKLNGEQNVNGDIWQTIIPSEVNVS